MMNFDRTQETVEINAGLKIVKLNGSEKFLDKEKKGYYLLTGYCFFHPEKGYYTTNNDDIPYIPAGGREALLSIIKSGGFTDFENANWLWPIK